MRKTLSLLTFFMVGGLAAAAVALASTAPKANLVYAGSTAHSHYSITLETQCTGKKCTKATTVEIQLTAGSHTKPISGCPFGGYEMPTGKISKNKFSVSTKFIATGNKLLSFKVSGNFTSATKLTGTVAGVSACGGSDKFSLTAKPAKQVQTITGPTAKG